MLSDTDIVSVLMKLYLKLELPLCALASLFLSDNSQTERQVSQTLITADLCLSQSDGSQTERQVSQTLSTAISCLTTISLGLQRKLHKFSGFE